MLPDFPEIKLTFKKVANKYIQNLVRQDPLISLARTETHFEGNRFAIKREDEEIDKSQYREFSGKFTVQREQIIEKGFVAYIEHFDKLAEEMKAQQAKLFFEKVEEATAKTGNTVNSKGQPFSPELLLETLDKMWVEFDDQGNPCLPTIFVSPQLGETIKDKLPEWDSDPEGKKKFDEMINKKRAEWNDRESNRKLVD